MEIVCQILVNFMSLGLKTIVRTCSNCNCELAYFSSLKMNYRKLSLITNFMKQAKLLSVPQQEIFSGILHIVKTVIVRGVHLDDLS